MALSRKIKINKQSQYKFYLKNTPPLQRRSIKTFIFWLSELASVEAKSAGTIYFATAKN